MNFKIPFRIQSFKSQKRKNRLNQNKGVTGCIID